MNELKIDTLLQIIENALIKGRDAQLELLDRDYFSNHNISLSHIDVVNMQHDDAVYMVKSLAAKVKKAEAVIEDLLELVDVPEANCSCHIAPPCHDCVEYSKTREVIENAKSFISES